MELTLNTVKRIAELSKLELSEEEIQQSQKELLQILQAFESLSKFPLPEELQGDARSALVLKQAHSASDETSRLQKDEANNSLSSQSFLAQAPEREGVFVRVPAILNSTT
jgi:aspartyl/glutamyl-tRNA(Asn/Gln) amidotransferase C subunit